MTKRNGLTARDYALLPLWVPFWILALLIFAVFDGYGNNRSPRMEWIRRRLLF